MSENNQKKWVGIRPTNPAENIPIVIGTSSGNFPVAIGAASGNFPVAPGTASGNFPVAIGAASGNFPVDIKAASVGVQILTPSTQQVFQTEPGPWAATRGGVTRTQIIKRAGVLNGSATIHTVTSGKTLYITSNYTVAFSTANSEGDLYVGDSGGSLQFYLIVLNTLAGQSNVCHQSYPMPIMVPAGYKIIIYGAPGYGEAGFTGWEE